MIHLNKLRFSIAHRQSHFPEKLLRNFWKISSKLALITGLTTCGLIFQVASTPAQPWTGGTYVPPRNVGAPDQTTSGSSRGVSIHKDNPQCPIVGSPLALVPIDIFGVTLKSHPTFLFYTPATRVGRNPPLIEYVLQDLQGNEVYKVRFISNSQGGIASLTLPKEAGFLGLVPDKDYYWTVAVICQGEVSNKDIIIQGLIRRVSAPIDFPDLVGKSPSEQAEILRQASIWYDAAIILGELQRGSTQPNVQWQALLESVGLQELMDQPFIQSPDR